MRDRREHLRRRLHEVGPHVRRLGVGAPRRRAPASSAPPAPAVAIGPRPSLPRTAVWPQLAACPAAARRSAAASAPLGRAPARVRRAALELRHRRRLVDRLRCDRTSPPARSRRSRISSGRGANGAGRGANAGARRRAAPRTAPAAARAANGSGRDGSERLRGANAELARRRQSTSAPTSPADRASCSPRAPPSRSAPGGGRRRAASGRRAPATATRAPAA